jgi:hypothetical protein
MAEAFPTFFFAYAGIQDQDRIQKNLGKPKKVCYTVYNKIYIPGLSMVGED